MAISLMAYPVRDTFSGYSHQSRNYLDHPRHMPSVGSTSSYSPYSYRPETHVPSSTSPRAPASPVPSESDSRPSLPSISKLLSIADRPNHEKPPQRSPVTSHPVQQPLHHGRPAMAPSALADHRPRSSFPNYELTSAHRPGMLPPTPPLRNDSVMDGRHSPSNTSPRSTYSQPSYLVSATMNHHEATHSSVHGPPPPKRQSLPAASSPHTGSTFANSPYVTSPSARSNASLYSAPETRFAGPPPPLTDMSRQQPLPTNFPPQPPAVPAQPSPGNTLHSGNRWEHHHYINPSSSATYPQSNERYICPTCNKAFSRPSSLKIHTHSHTGEKPFKCPHSGCGKAFSVRSNMKRHERGCHTGVGEGSSALETSTPRML